MCLIQVPLTSGSKNLKPLEEELAGYLCTCFDLDAFNGLDFGSTNPVVTDDEDESSQADDGSCILEQLEELGKNMRRNLLCSVCCV